MRILKTRKFTTTTPYLVGLSAMILFILVAFEILAYLYDVKTKKSGPPGAGLDKLSWFLFYEIIIVVYILAVVLSLTLKNGIKLRLRSAWIVSLIPPLILYSWLAFSALSSESRNIGVALAVFRSDDVRLNRLLSLGASPNEIYRDGTIDPKGNTLLIVAVSKNDKTITEILLKNGASISAKNFAGLTAEDIAREKGYQEMQDLIVRYK